MAVPKKMSRVQEGGGRGTASVGGASRSLRKPVVKVQPKPNTKTEPKSNVKVVSNKTKTAPKTGLENRGNKPSKSERSTRAQDYSFEKKLGKYYSNQDRLAGTHPSDMPKRPAGPSARNARKDAAISKEAKQVYKITGK